jgi:hypothetical protein
MIKMTINPQAEPKSFCFNQDIIIIGEGSPESVDICFPSEGLHQNHIKILHKDNAYWVINQANDPFVTINGHPFGKKMLQMKDLLQIRNHIMVIDEISFQPYYESSLAPEPASQSHLEPDLTYPSLPDFENLDHSENPLSWFPPALNPPKTPTFGPPPPAGRINPVHAHSISPLIEEAYNLEEQKRPLKPSRPLSKSKSLSFKKKIIKFTVLACFSSAVILGLTFTELYFRAASKSSKEEMLAAETLADYAMALSFAKTAHAGAQNNHWIDPGFIKSYLAELLAAPSLPCGKLDAQGQFSNCPYMLRYYMNRDFTRFILIAQATPSLLQWFLPHKTLVVDSNLMEVRKTDDLRTLNRLLSDPTPLEGIVGDEVTKAVLQTEIIPLDAIAEGTKKKEFSPPRGLKYMKPGAENLIYNAPRYYQFGSSFMKKAQEASKSYEVSILQNEMNALSPFHDLVFYSKDGLENAKAASGALHKLKTPLSFFTAYLIFSKQGLIQGSHLVINNDPPASSQAKSPQDKPDAEEEAVKPSAKAPGVEEILASILKEKGEHAQEMINPIFQNLHNLLENAIEKDSIFLPPMFFQLFEQYRDKQKHIWSDIQNTVAKLKSDYPQVSEPSLKRLLREYGLLDTYTLLLSELGVRDGELAASPPLPSIPELRQARGRGWGWVELIADMGGRDRDNGRVGDNGRGNGEKKGIGKEPPFLD